MVKTNNTLIQSRINAMAHVKSESSSTMLASKQALYNRMFKANNFIQYVPNGNESKFELLANYKIHIAITTHCLNRLASLGNLNAMELNNNINHTVSKEDLTQEMLLWFAENEKEWEIDFYGKVTFSDDETIKGLFTCVSGYLRKFQTKHYKHQYIEIDGNIVDVNKVTELADYVSIDNLLENIELQNFINSLSGIDKEWLLLRLQGLSNMAISKELNITYKKVRCIESRLRKAWNK